MNVSIGEHITLLCYSFFVGVFLAALYDAVRLVRTFLGLGIDYADSPVISNITPPIIGKRKRRERKKTGQAAAYAVIFIFDMLYMLAATAVVVIFIYHAHSGTPRGFAFAGAGIGFYLYMKTAGRLTASAASYIFFMIDTAVRYIVYFTVTPIRFFVKCTVRVLRRAYRATVYRAIVAAMMKKSESRQGHYIKKKLQNTLAGIAEAIARDGTE